MIEVLVASHTKDTDDELKVRIEYRYQKVFNNPTYPMFQPQAIQMGVFLGDFKTTSNAVKDNGGGKLLIDIRNKSRNNLSQCIKLFNAEVQVVANRLPHEEAEAFALGTGADLKKAKATAAKRVTFLDVPQNFTVVDDKDRRGWCMLNWEAVENALTYLIEELDKAGNWQTRGVCSKTTLFLGGTDYEVKKTFRIRAAGLDTLVGDYTEAVSVWVR
jgi:hypothetical protein